CTRLSSLYGLDSW
nr:immunoglobulin heavy chain junction region [Macaca mulatta]